MRKEADAKAVAAAASAAAAFEARRRREERTHGLLYGLWRVVCAAAGGVVGVPLGLLGGLLLMIPVGLVLLIPGLILYLFDIDIFQPVINFIWAVSPAIGGVAGLVFGFLAASAPGRSAMVLLLALAVGIASLHYSDAVRTWAIAWTQYMANAFDRDYSPGGADTSTRPADDRPAPPPARGDPAARSDPGDWRLVISGLGPIRVGTTFTDAVDLLSEAFSSVSVQWAGLPYEAASAPGLVVVARIGSVTALRMDGPWSTRSGLKIGDSVARMRRLYGDRLLEVRGSDSASYGVYFFVPRDDDSADLRVVFRTGGGRVELICAGLLPDVARLCMDAADFDDSADSDSADAHPG